MKKKLITIKNYLDYVCDGKFIVTSDMIITPGAKDIIRDKGIGVKYEKCCCESESKMKNEIKKDCQNLEQKVIDIIKKEFKITDSETVQKILSKLKELL